MFEYTEIPEGEDQAAEAEPCAADGTHAETGPHVPPGTTEPDARASTFSDPASPLALVVAAYAAAAAQLHAVSLDTATPSDILAVLAAAETVTRAGGAFGHTLMTAVVERDIHRTMGHRNPAALLVDTLRLSGADAAARVKSARNLGVWHNMTGEPLPPNFPCTAVAESDGAIGKDHTRVIAKIIAAFPGRILQSDIDVSEEILATAARSCSPDDLYGIGRSLIAALCPDGSGDDDKDRARKRSFTVDEQDEHLMSHFSGYFDPTTRALLDPILEVWSRLGMNNPADPLSPRGDGTDTGLSSYLPGGSNAPDGMAADKPKPTKTSGKSETATAATAKEVADLILAGAAARDTRTAPQRRHDALSAVFRAVVAGGVLGSHRGVPATVIITMRMVDLEAGCGFATTATGGVMPLADALALAECAHNVLALFDHNGRPLHFGRLKRLASTDQRLSLYAAERGCTRPGCKQPATRCAVHHIIEWRDDGFTDIEVLTLVCDSCHALIHSGPAGWITRVADSNSEYPGSTEWIPPACIDPTRTPRVNHRHHPERVIEKARANAERNYRERKKNPVSFRCEPQRRPAGQ